MARATLLVIHGIDQGSRFELGATTAVLGRGVGCDIRLRDHEVSRNHAIIDFDQGAWNVRDNQSSNGTLINGIRCNTHRLHQGDRIHVGGSIIAFSLEAAADDEATHLEKMVALVGDPSGDHSNIVATVQGPPADFSNPAPDFSSPALQNLRTLYQISEEVVSPTHSLSESLQRILDLTLESVGADRGCILASNQQTGKLEPQVVSPANVLPADGPIPISTTIVDYVLNNGQAVRTSNAQSDDRFAAGKSIVQTGIREAICVPMRGHSDLLGVIYIDTNSQAGLVEATEKFTEDHLKLVLAIGRQAALAIESKNFELALVKAERFAAMGQTITMISHHIKNILQGVRGGSYLIDTGLQTEDTELVRNGWSIVDRNQQRISNLVLDMLSFSKERQPILTAASPSDTVLEVCDLLKPRADELEIQFDVVLADDMPIAMYDVDGIHRALLNVVTNAFDAVDGAIEPMVRVETHFDKAHELLLIGVADNGPGIPDDQLDTIFNVFESSKGARGTGLGLAVSQKIIHEHGGQINVESRLSQGTRFTLGWPWIAEHVHDLGDPPTGAARE